MSSFPYDPNVATLVEAKDWLRDRVDKGATCPCCNRKAKVYRRKINSGMAWVLIRIYRQTLLGRVVGAGWVHIHDIFEGYGQKHRDWSTLRHWGLIEGYKRGRDPKRLGAGYWRVTKEGKLFAGGLSRVPLYLRVYDNRVLGPSRETVSVQEALGSAFDYDELMRA